MNILIVDDEYMVRTGIETMIQRSGFEWKVVGKASNGLEALQLLESAACEVDVIITDIKMPEMNGMELMEHIHRCNYQCEVIVLSSYADFEFAQKAVKYRAVNYLLKPVDPDELMKDLQKAEDTIQSRLKRKLEQEEQTKRKEFMIQLLLTRLLFDYHTDEVKIRYELEQVGIQLSELLIVTAARPAGWAEEERTSLKRAVYSAIDGLGLYAEDVSIESRLLVLVIWSSRERMDIAGIERSLTRLLDERTGAAVYFGLSDVCTNVSDIAATFNQSICCNEWAVKARRPIASLRDVDEKDYLIQYPYALEHKLLFAFKSGNIEDVQALTQELADELFSSKVSNLYRLVLISNQTLAAFKRLLLEMNNSLSQLFKLDLDVHSHVAQFSDSGMVKSWFLKSMEQITEQMLQSKKTKSRKIIEQMKEIIYERYNQDIQIRQIADELSMNASYLSDLFKQFTQMTFTEFVIEYRMQKAKELLTQDANMKMYEVAEIVGYRNPKHFSQIFKKHVGVLPADFRNIP